MACVKKQPLVETILISCPAEAQGEWGASVRYYDVPANQISVAVLDLLETLSKNPDRMDSYGLLFDRVVIEEGEDVAKMEPEILRPLKGCFKHLVDVEYGGLIKPRPGTIWVRALVLPDWQ